MSDIKQFLYAWCGKQKTVPNYEFRSAGSKNRQRFICEVYDFSRIIEVSAIHNW